MHLISVDLNNSYNSYCELHNGYTCRIGYLRFGKLQLLLFWNRYEKIATSRVHMVKDVDAGIFIGIKTNTKNAVKGIVITFCSMKLIILLLLIIDLITDRKSFVMLLLWEVLILWSMRYNGEDDRIINRMKQIIIMKNS